MYDPELVECFLSLPWDKCYLNIPSTNAAESPLNMETIKEKQQEDTDLLRLSRKHPQRYLQKQVGKVRNVICYVKEGEDPEKKWRIALPHSMVKPAIKWFHTVTGHPESKKTASYLGAKV